MKNISALPGHVKYEKGSKHDCKGMGGMHDCKGMHSGMKAFQKQKLKKGKKK